MASLPTPSGSDGTYGTELNEWALIDHNNDGTHSDITATSVTATTVTGTTITASGFFGLGSASELTIASGIVTATQSHHTIDTQSDASTDNLDTINGGSEGDLLIISANNSARTVVAKDASGNLSLAGDFSMGSIADKLTLIRIGAQWVETSRSDNAT